MVKGFSKNEKYFKFVGTDTELFSLGVLEKGIELMSAVWGQRPHIGAL